MHYVTYVRLIKVTGVLSFSQLSRLVSQRYPDARFQVGEESGTAFIAIPDLLWNASPHGAETFFRGLCSSGAINGFRHKRYSDQEEVRF